MSTQEWISVANVVLNLLIIPLVVFMWRVSTAVVRMEQILHAHEQRITRAEKNLDEASRQGDVNRRKS